MAAAKQLHEEGSAIRLAKVDATVETAIAEKHEVSGYPTLKFYKNGKFSEYKGARSFLSLVTCCSAWSWHVLRVQYLILVYCTCQVLLCVGGRKGPLIAEWLKKKTGPSLLTLDNVEEAKKFIDTHQIAVIAFVKVGLFRLFADSLFVL